MEESASSCKHSHLNSATYRTLLRIITHFQSPPQLFGTHLVTSPKISDCVSDGVDKASRGNVGGRTGSTYGNSVSKCEKVGMNATALDSGGSVKSKYANKFIVSKTVNRMAKAKEDVFCISESGLTNKNIDLRLNCLPCGKSSEDQESFNELENALKGINRVNTDENIIKVPVDSDMDKVLRCQTISEGDCTSTSFKVHGLPLVSLSPKYIKDNNSLRRRDEVCASAKLFKKEGSMEKFLATATSASLSPVHQDGSSDMEEGEISGDVSCVREFMKPNASTSLTMNMAIEATSNNKCDAVPPLCSLSTTNFDESGGADKEKDMNYFASKRKLVVYEDHLLNTNDNSSNRKNNGCGAKRQKKLVDIKKQKKSTTRFKIGEEVEEKLVGYDVEKTLENFCSTDTIGAKVTDTINTAQAEVSNHEIATVLEVDSTIKDPGGRKKKRGAITDERKAKKKLKERMKRAQKNRELGVKRLKLRPVQASKPLSFCRHFLKGRCQQGDECKFSHDTIPLTKSKPCCHFARQSCLKGDSCPFDHHLSKYPCNNFVTQGSCNRGKACLFSHNPTLHVEMPLSNISESTSRVLSSMLEVSVSNKQHDHSATPNEKSRHLDSAEKSTPKKTMEPSSVATSVPLTAQMQKKATSMSSCKQAAVHCNHPQMIKTSLTDKTIKCINSPDLSESGFQPNLIQNIVAVPRPMKGINFLSFVKPSSTVSATCVPLEGSDLQKITSCSNLSPNQQHSIKSVDEQAKSITQWKSYSSFNDKKTLPLTPAGVLASHPRTINPDERLSISPNPWTLGDISSFNLEKSSNAVRKTLMSTIAFGAKIQSQMNSRGSSEAR